MRTLPDVLSRVHMVGIGGAGMSGIARILLDRGGQVSGSDARESSTVEALRARGAHIQIGHDARALDLLPGGPTVVVTTHAAVPKDNVELSEARRRGIDVILRPAVLADLMRGYRNLLVAGTHGKTSTTSMAVVALTSCGIEPSFAVGGEIAAAGTNAQHGGGDVFIAEADESDASLLRYSPTVAVITNVDADHLDFFGSVANYVRVFDDFVDVVAPGGVLVVCLDDSGSACLAQRSIDRLTARGVRVLGYGEGIFADLAPAVPLAARITSWAPTASGSTVSVSLVSSVVVETPRDVTVPLRVPGVHMARNAVGAMLGCLALEVASLEQVVSGLKLYAGVNRRFEPKGTARDVRVFDDYAHHPTEVAAVLSAARNVASIGSRSGRVIVVFQPHLYSRTLEFAGEFAEALSAADRVLVLDVYGARENPLPGVTGELISSIINREGGVKASFESVMYDVPDVVAAFAEPGDIVLTLGAGDVTTLGPMIVAALAS